MANKYKAMYKNELARAAGVSTAICGVYAIMAIV